MDIRNILNSEINRARAVDEKVKKILSELPKGNLKIYKNGAYFKYNMVKRNKIIKLTQNDREIIEALAMKAVYEDMTKSIAEYICKTEKYMEETKNIDITGTKFMIDNPGIAYAVEKRYVSKEEKMAEWENAEYKSSAGYPEKLIYSTMKGHLVRSKSEMNIANQAYIQNVPYRYECDMLLKNGPVTVDFLLKNSRTMVEVPWEHLGMLDISDYFDNTGTKLKKYISSGFFPSINMILSFELDGKPLDTVYIQRLIDQFWEISSIKYPWKPQFRYPQ